MQSQLEYCWHKGLLTKQIDGGLPDSHCGICGQPGPVKRVAKRLACRGRKVVTPIPLCPACSATWETSETLFLLWLAFGLLVLPLLGLIAGGVIGGLAGPGSFDAIFWSGFGLGMLAWAVGAALVRFRVVWRSQYLCADIDQDVILLRVPQPQMLQRIWPAGGAASFFDPAVYAQRSRARRKRRATLAVGLVAVVGLYEVWYTCVGRRSQLIRALSETGLTSEDWRDMEAMGHDAVPSLIESLPSASARGAMRIACALSELADRGQMRNSDAQLLLAHIGPITPLAFADSRCPVNECPMWAQLHLIHAVDSIHALGQIPRVLQARYLMLFVGSGNNAWGRELEGEIAERALRLARLGPEVSTEVKAILEKRILGGTIIDNRYCAEWLVACSVDASWMVPVWQGVADDASADDLRVKLNTLYENGHGYKFWAPIIARLLVAAADPSERSNPGYYDDVDSLRRFIDIPSIRHHEGVRAALSQLVGTLRRDLQAEGFKRRRTIVFVLGWMPLEFSASTLFPLLEESAEEKGERLCDVAADAIYRADYERQIPQGLWTESRLPDKQRRAYDGEIAQLKDWWQRTGRERYGQTEDPK